MKVVLFRQRLAEKADKTEKKRFEKRFEWFMFKLFVTAFIILIAAQLALLSPAVRLSVSENFYNYGIEGEPLGQEVYLFVPFSMELKLGNLDRCPDLKVLVNGVEREAFVSNTVLLELKDGDVVELDASDVLVLAKVQVSAVSENFTSILGKTLSVTDGIIPVARVKTSQ